MKKDKQSKKKVNLENSKPSPLELEEILIRALDEHFPEKVDPEPSPLLELLGKAFEEDIILFESSISSLMKHNPFLVHINPKFVYAHLKGEKLTDEKPSVYSNLLSDPGKAGIFEGLVYRLFNFGHECKKMESICRLGTREEIKEAYKTLKRKQVHIGKLLTRLIPKKATAKVPRHHYLRQCKLFPENLTCWVNLITSRLKECREDTKKKFTRADNTYRKQEALKIFCEREVLRLYTLFSLCNRPIKLDKEELRNLISPEVIDENANPYIALKVLSLFAGCSYKELYDLYYHPKKNKSKQPTKK